MKTTTNGLTRKAALSCVGDGWARFINNLYDAKPNYVSVIQVKEKYGLLHFYVSSAPDWYFDLIDHYEQESCKTCEVCGKPGRLRTDRMWLLTLCDKCNEER